MGWASMRSASIRRWRRCSSGRNSGTRSAWCAIGSITISRTCATFTKYRLRIIRSPSACCPSSGAAHRLHRSGRSPSLILRREKTMKNLLRIFVVMIAIGSIAGYAQQGAAPAGGQGRGGRGAGGAAAANTPPPVPSISKRPTGSSLGTIRAGAQDNNIWFGWRVGTPSTAIKGQTLSETLAVADINSVPQVEASSTQLVANEIPKPLDYRLQAGERGAVNYRLRELGESIMAYRVDKLPADAETLRKVFDFAKAINAPLIVTGADAASIPDLDKVAEDFGINVALESRSDPKALMATLASHSN